MSKAPNPPQTFPKPPPPPAPPAVQIVASVSELKWIVSLTCLQTKCKHNSTFKCNLKRIIIGKDGLCTSCMVKS